ncbi:MAG: four helix bundle protein [Oscillospiraceae bacterium]|nr:four helix bundle protein [Oscillospiraceae bacterium]
MITLRGGGIMADSKLRELSTDFVVKLQIALKECYETEYWLELFVRSEILSRDVVAELYTQCGTIRRILIASIKTAKENMR